MSKFFESIGKNLFSLCYDDVNDIRNMLNKVVIKNLLN